MIKFRTFLAGFLTGLLCLAASGSFAQDPDVDLDAVPAVECPPCPPCVTAPDATKVKAAQEALEALEALEQQTQD